MKRYFILFIIIFIVNSVKAQWECPSKLAANFDPVGNSSLLLAGEISVSTGFLDGNSINSALGFLGADYSFHNHSFYFEGGLKSWAKYNVETENLFHKVRFGVRELFYQYRGKTNNLTVGIQTSSLDDHFILNERIAGINYSIESGRWKFTAVSGSVTKDFARNGIYCTTGFLYELSTGQNSALLGNTLGDKNMGGFSLTYFPKKEKMTAQISESHDDEFEAYDSNEFEAFDNNEFESFEPEPTSGKSNFLTELEKAGIVAYSEFGKWIQQPLFIAGAFAEIKLPGDIFFKPEILVQEATENKALIYITELDKTISLKNGHRLTLNTGWYNFTEIDKGAMLLNSYSNILAGEVLRLDAANMPFYLFGIKYNIPSTKLHFKIQNVNQFNSNNLKEWDLAIGKQFKKKLLVNTKFGLINGGDLPENIFLGRLEIRYYF